MRNNIKRTPYRSQKERVIISDILPYEIPLIFSNRYFYDFITEYHIYVCDNKFYHNDGNIILDAIIHLLFGFKNNPDNPRIIDYDNFKKIPFGYKIGHKETDFRELTIVHPLNQLQLIEFYERYKSLIIYYSGISPFSLRHPHKVAKSIYYKDEAHKKKLAATHKTDSIEQNDREYENLKTFFAYRTYSNIHKFYESYKYHRCEKKYNKLFKFDISKCFDSIYTHSICWALLHKKNVKENLSESKTTFSGKFDALMQNLNYGETHGIVIGPEFSRIFAELILQQIDNKIFALLKDKHNLKFKIDYEIFRYVDDYFIFYNDEAQKDLILSIYRLQLKEYKLYLNDSKTILYNKPIITEITIAKQKISDLLNEELKVNIIDIILDNGDISEEKSGQIYVSSNNLITRYKTIIKETGTEYKDILNYTFAIIERKVEKIVLEHIAIGEKCFTNAIMATLEFTFFLYSVSPRANTTIKLCQILRHITKLLNGFNDINVDNKHLIYKYVFDNTHLILRKNKTSEYTQIETLYLLIALRELGREYLLDVNVLYEYFGIEKAETGLIFKTELNYFSITVLLFYIKNKIRYNYLKIAIKDCILNQFKKAHNTHKDAEKTFLLFDILSCPFLDSPFKKEMLSLHQVPEDLHQQIINFREIWFTKWEDFDFFNELEAKKSKEVY